MQTPSFSNKIAPLRAKRDKKSGSSYSIKSFVHGFVCATFMSYFGFCCYFATSGQNSSTLSVPTIESPTLSPFVRSIEDIKVNDLGLAGNNPPSLAAGDKIGGPVVAQILVASPTPSPKAAISDWDRVGTQTAEMLQGGPFSSKNLVLGIAINTDAKNFAIFYHSYRKFSPLGEAIVFVNAPVSERHRRIATTSRVRLISFDVTTLQPEFIRTYHPSSLRWILFDQLLRANNHAIQRAFSRVIMVDVRDTVFQSNPFTLVQGTAGALHVFAEAPGSTIELCGWNSAWVKDCFGERVFNTVKSSPIICSGVSMGSMDVVQEYVGKMASVLLGQDEIGKSFPACERNGVDQGVHNVLVHTHRLKNVTVQFEYDFPVVNLQAYPQLQPPLSEPSLLVSEAGVKYAIVHQYDRLSTLQTALAMQYVHWINVSDPQAEWEKEPTCGIYTVAYEKDLFRGKCELASQRVMSAASCCQVCQGKNKPIFDTIATSSVGDYPVETVCSAFTYVDGICYMKTCRQTEITASLNDPIQKFYAQPNAISAYVRFQK